MPRSHAALLIVGALYVVGGIALIYVPAAVIVAGLAILAYGLTRELRPAADTSKEPR